MKKIALFALCSVLFVQAYAQYTVESVPNQKLINNSYVSNPDLIIDGSMVVEIDSILTRLERNATAQVAVVAINSIGNADIFDFAQDLFNTWGIGQASNSNGLLILLVEDKRQVRFHTGDGLEGVLPDATCKRIQREFMIPEFKNGNYGAGILAAVKEVERILANPEHRDEVASGDDEEEASYAGFLFGFILFIFTPVLIAAFMSKIVGGKFSKMKNESYTPYPEMRYTRWEWLLIFGGMPLLILGLFNITEDIGMAVLTLYVYFLLTAVYKLMRSQKVIRRFVAANRDYYQVVEFLRKTQWYWLFAAFVFPLPFAIYFFYHLARKRIYRNHPRTCLDCNGVMRKLSEKEDDAFLSPNKIMEESLKSVDYDVWQCESCQSTEEWNYPRNSSKYKDCPYCKTKAFYLVGRKTLQSATYSSSGEGEETHTCKFCGKSKKEKYTIARLVASTSSSGSSFGGSSSGGSWGGGRSSGGGATSSW